MNQLPEEVHAERKYLKPLMHAILHPYRPVYGGDREIVEYCIYEKGRNESIAFLEQLCAKIKNNKMTETPLFGEESQSKLRDRAIQLVSAQIERQRRLPKTVSPNRTTPNTACSEAVLTAITNYAYTSNLLQEYFASGWNEIIYTIHKKIGVTCY